MFLLVLLLMLFLFLCLFVCFLVWFCVVFHVYIDSFCFLFRLLISQWVTLRTVRQRGWFPFSRCVFPFSLNVSFILTGKVFCYLKVLLNLPIDLDPAMSCSSLNLSALLLSLAEDTREESKTIAIVIFYITCNSKTCHQH